MKTITMDYSLYETELKHERMQGHRSGYLALYRLLNDKEAEASDFTDISSYLDEVSTLIAWYNAIHGGELCLE